MVFTPHPGTDCASIYGQHRMTPHTSATRSLRGTFERAIAGRCRLVKPYYFKFIGSAPHRDCPSFSTIAESWRSPWRLLCARQDHGCRRSWPKTQVAGRLVMASRSLKPKCRYSFAAGFWPLRRRNRSQRSYCAANIDICGMRLPK